MPSVLWHRLLRLPQGGILTTVESFCVDGANRICFQRNYSADSTNDSSGISRDGEAGPRSPRGQRPPRSRHYKDRYGSASATTVEEYDESDGKMKTIHRVTPMSKDLLALYQAVVKEDKKALGKYSRDGPLTDKEMVLLADAIEFYFAMAPASSSNVDGLRHADRNALAALAKIIRAYKGADGRDAALPKDIPISSPLEKIVVNTAPSGRLPWLSLGANEEIGALYWGVDLTGGKAKDPWSNARLSLAAKNLMYSMYTSDPKTYTPGKLAELFCIREQRAMAILRLKELEANSQDENSIGDEVAKVMEQVLQCHQGIGSNEKHYTTLPSFPAYARLQQEDVIPELEKVLGKSIEDITVDDITPEVSKQVFGTKTLEEMEDVVAAREEKHLVEEFKQRLDYNLGMTGKTISRDSRRTKAPRRPKEGWSLIITPIGKESKMKHERYVAMPDGSQRELNQDELLYMERKKPRPRRRIL